MERKCSCCIQFQTSKKNLILINHFCRILHISQDELLNRILTFLSDGDADVLSTLYNVKVVNKKNQSKS